MRAFRKVVIFIIANILVASLLRFALNPVSVYVYDEKIKDFYSGDYNSVIIGSSYGRNLVADFLPEGKHVYNLSRARVSIEDFYYIVKELDKQKGLEKVYFDVCVPYWTGELGDCNRINMKNILSGLNKWEYFWKILTRQNYNDFFFRYEMDYSTLKFIPSTVSQKFSLLMNGSIEKKDKEIEQGLVKSEVRAKPTAFSSEQIMPEHVDTFKELASYCTEHDIELIGYMTAFPNERLLVDDWEPVHNYFTELFNSCGFTVYDMNYVKWDCFKRPTELYKDLDGHMLEPLAIEQTEILSKILTAEDSTLYFEKDFEKVLEKIREIEKEYS